MTHQEENSVFDYIMLPLIAAWASCDGIGFATAMDLAMEIKREQDLEADSRQRTDEWRGWANAFKPKTMRPCIGDLSLRIQQTR